MLHRLALALVGGPLLAAPAAAAEKKPAQLRDYPFWTAPKQPQARAFVPGLQAALQLTTEQIEKIEAACRETIDKPEAQGKNAPGAAAAREKLAGLVAGILTDAQKIQIEKVNDAYAKVLSAMRADFEAQFTSAKGNKEEMAKVNEDYRKAVSESMEKRLDGILSDEQRDAVKKAAEVEKKNQEEGKKKPKPGK